MHSHHSYAPEDRDELIDDPVDAGDEQMGHHGIARRPNFIRQQILNQFAYLKVDRRERDLFCTRKNTAL